MNQPVSVPEVLSADLPAGVFLVDVREDDEWTAGHAPDAVHVRLGELGPRAQELPREQEGCESVGPRKKENREFLGKTGKPRKVC